MPSNMSKKVIADSQKTRGAKVTMILSVIGGVLFFIGTLIILFFGVWQ